MFVRLNAVRFELGVKVYFLVPQGKFAMQTGRSGAGKTGRKATHTTLVEKWTLQPYRFRTNTPKTDSISALPPCMHPLLLRGPEVLRKLRVRCVPLHYFVQRFVLDKAQTGRAETRL